MEIRELPIDDYEKVVVAKDPESQLHALIAVHDTTLGPALGGMRMWPYKSEEAALTDVLRLSKGMTFKSAIAHTGLGGGKSVIIGDPKTIKSEKLYRAMGRFIDHLGGLYITAEDVNTSIEDLEIVRQETRYVTGLSRASGSSGNPSPYTARGCVLGIQKCVERAFDGDSVSGKHIVLQGVGAVGSIMARELRELGAHLSIYDMNVERAEQLAKELDAEILHDDDVLSADCDVLAPCALGAILNDETIPALRCKVIAGCANNQLATLEHGDLVRQRGILYAPDYVINAGGIINVAVELMPGGYDEAKSLERVRRIPDALEEIFELSEREHISTAEAAHRRALEILAEGRREHVTN
ncbi:MAG: Glu/Leu/Phe/Val dehydrogenase [Planctomycetes bacterium]|nr:Glu/Leu/Phe/Val dehydrogenase [Planctomycetota bacterium]